MPVPWQLFFVVDAFLQWNCGEHGRGPASPQAKSFVRSPCADALIYPRHSRGAESKILHLSRNRAPACPKCCACKIEPQHVQSSTPVTKLSPSVTATQTNQPVKYCACHAIQLHMLKALSKVPRASQTGPPLRPQHVHSTARVTKSSPCVAPATQTDPPTNPTTPNQRVSSAVPVMQSSPPAFPVGGLRFPQWKGNELAAKARWATACPSSGRQTACNHRARTHRPPCSAFANLHPEHEAVSAARAVRAPAAAPRPRAAGQERCTWVWVAIPAQTADDGGVDGDLRAVPDAAVSVLRPQGRLSSFRTLAFCDTRPILDRPARALAPKQPRGMIGLVR